MNKKELLELIRKTQKDIKDTMERLQYNINDLDEIRKNLILMPDDITVDDKWVTEQEATDDIIRQTSAIKEKI